MRNAVAESGGKNATVFFFYGKFLHVRICADRIAICVNRTHAPIIFSGIGTRVFVVTAEGAFNLLCPLTIFGRLRIVVFVGCRRSDHKLNFIILTAVQRYPLINGINRFCRIRHLIEVVDQGFHWQRFIGLDINRLSLGEFANRFMVEAKRAHTPIQDARLAIYKRCKIDLIAICKYLLRTVKMILARHCCTAFGIGLVRENFQLVADGSGNAVPDEERLAACRMIFRVFEDGTRPQRLFEIWIFNNIGRRCELPEHPECRDAVIHGNRRRGHLVGSLEGQLRLEGMIFRLAFNKSRRLGKRFDSVEAWIGKPFP